ncbi:MAG: radical SAM protein [Candidatus Verstraetearchaeota archaeon]|nr:radical SAM protein [Candidatus Verstraetearchaeota archaeon]
MPEGCRLCLNGGKMVLFITGICEKNCFYCPLSKERKGKDVVFADEVKVREPLDVILECRAIDAEGTGITGGDPLMKVKRTLKYIRLLKREFGKEHHIHLYTSGRFAGRDVLLELKEAGLDEIRFHPTSALWDRIAVAKQVGLCAGAELPSIPGEEKKVKAFIEFLDQIGADFLNLNQLEFSPGNALQMKQRGFDLEKGGISAVRGSEEAAMKLINWAASEGIRLPIHYCRSQVKDAIQTRKRIIRRSKNVARPHEEILEDGLLGKVIITSLAAPPRELRKKIAQQLGIPIFAIGISDNDKAIELHRKMLEVAKGALADAKFEYVQTYPTFSREKFFSSPC